MLPVMLFKPSNPVDYVYYPVYYIEQTNQSLYYVYVLSSFIDVNVNDFETFVKLTLIQVARLGRGFHGRNNWYSYSCS